MCGINGILRRSPDAPPIDRDELLGTSQALRSRGPDGHGHFLDDQIGLAHRRLAIIDLSDAGAQPMTFADRYTIVFNGEIYNYAELRAELVAEGVTFSSESDTEVVLALYAREGDEMLAKLRGMYAFALWDAHEQCLLLARDPYGIKPLYYCVDGQTLRFASQIKALERSDRISLATDPAAVVGFLLWGSVPEPLTIRRSIRALPAGHLLRVRRGELDGPIKHYRFGQHSKGASPDAVTAIGDSVRAHLVSDVPVAVFLSAGFDSTMIAALAARELGAALTTFTLKFDAFAGTDVDEAPLAAQVARAIGARHVRRRRSPHPARPGKDCRKRTRCGPPCRPRPPRPFPWPA